MNISDQDPLMKCTGRKDKNGNLIFENDWCRISAEEPYSNSQFSTDYDWELEGLIQWVDCAWAVVFADGSCIFLSEIINSDIKIEVLYCLTEKVGK